MIKVDPKREGIYIGRGDSFSNTLSLLLDKNKLNYYTIVEIGTTRGGYGGGPNGDGWATLAWGWFVDKYGGEVHTIDIDKECLDQCKAITNRFSHKIQYHHCSGEDFLKEFKSKIDLLYLDGSDDPNEMVSEYLLAKNLLTKSSLILLDDIPQERLENGKGAKGIPMILSDGWVEVYHDTTMGVMQMLFERGNDD